MKFNFRLLYVTAVVVVLFGACSKDEVVEPEFVEEHQAASKKFGAPTPPRVVRDIHATYYPGGVTETYRTRIIGTQEWIVEDWRNETVDNDIDREFGVFKAPGGECYYQWANVLEGTPQSVWDTYVFDRPGFHIPTVADMDKLVKELGDWQSVVAQLELTTRPYLNFSSTRGDFREVGIPEPMRIWVDQDHSGNQFPGCGVLYLFNSPWHGDLRMGESYINSPLASVRVRLVRNL